MCLVKKTTLPYAASGPVFGGHVRAFLTPNVHKVIKPHRVDVLFKMHVKIGSGVKFNGASDGYLEFSKFGSEISTFWKNGIFLPTTYIYIFLNFSKNKKSSTRPPDIR